MMTLAHCSWGTDFRSFLTQQTYFAIASTVDAGLFVWENRTTRTRGQAATSAFYGSEA